MRSLSPGQVRSLSCDYCQRSPILRVGREALCEQHALGRHAGDSLLALTVRAFAAQRIKDGCYTGPDRHCTVTDRAALAEGGERA